MLRSELELVKRIVSQSIDPAHETTGKCFDEINKQLADLKKEIKDLKKEIEDVKRPTVQLKDKK